MNAVRPLAFVAIVAVALAACAQVLGIRDVHDDPADGQPPGDAVAPDAWDAETESDAVPEAALDAGAEAEAGPDPALGCPKTAQGYQVFMSKPGFGVPIAIDGAYLYAAGINGLYRCSVEGCVGTQTTIAASMAADVASNGRHIIWSDPMAGSASGVIHISTSDGTDVALVNGAVAALAVAGDDIYGLEPGAIKHLYDAPGSIDASAGYFVQVPQASFVAIAASAQGVVYTKQDDGGVEDVYLCPPVDCPSPVLVATPTSISGNGSDVHVAIDDAAVYWTDPAGGKVLSCPLTGCGSAQPQTVVQSNVSALYVDAKGLYWAVNDTSGKNVYRGLTDGGSPLLVAASPGVVTRLTANDACVYWSTSGSKGSNTRGDVVAAPQP